MSEIQRLLDQMQRAFSGEAWHGPAVQELLAKIPAAHAAAKPLPNAHSIWEIVLHIAVWKSIVRRRLAGEVVADVPPEQDWPAVRSEDEAAWVAAQKELKQAHQELLAAVAQCSEARLAELVPGQKMSIYVMLHGIVQHDLYHAGQIALLQRAQA